MLIREAYPTHQPAHTGIKKEQVQELKQAFKDAGSTQPSTAIKAEVERCKMEAKYGNSKNRPTTKES